MIDKYDAMLEFIQQFNAISDNPIFFNFGDTRENANKITASSDDKSLDIHYIDGSVRKQFTFNIDTNKNVAYNPIVSGITDENLDNFQQVIELSDWINEQGEIQNFPDFGSNCIIESMRTKTSQPYLYGIDNSLNPSIATYRTSIQIEYIDITNSISL